MYLFCETERAEEGQRERERENPRQSQGCQHRAQCEARAHKLWDCDLSQNQELDAQPTEPPRHPRVWILTVSLIHSLVLSLNNSCFSCDISGPSSDPVHFLSLVMPQSPSLLCLHHRMNKLLKVFFWGILWLYLAPVHLACSSDTIELLSFHSSFIWSYISHLLLTFICSKHSNG